MSVCSSLMRAGRSGNYHIYLYRTVMMSPDDRSLEDLLYGSDLVDEAEGLELGGGQAGMEESGDTIVENVSMK